MRSQKETAQKLKKGYFETAQLEAQKAKEERMTEMTMALSKVAKCGKNSRDVLRRVDGDKARAAEILGISLRTLYRRLETP